MCQMRLCSLSLIMLAGARDLASSESLPDSVPDASDVSFLQAGLDFQQSPEEIPRYPAVWLEDQASDAFAARHPGCDPSEIHDHAFRRNMHDPEYAKALQEGSANPMHYSSCKRTKSYFNDIELVMKENDWQLPQNPRIISVGCSIGYEAQEARARFPTADEIVCYDLDPDIIAEGKASTDPSYNITFTANRDDLVEHSFDMVLINNVLFSYMSPEEFTGFMDDVLSWPTREHALFELMVYNNNDPGMQIAPSKSGMVTTKSFDENVAWRQLFKTFKDGSQDIRYHKGLVTSVASHLFFAKW